MIWWLYVNERLLTFFVSPSSIHKPLVLRTRLFNSLFLIVLTGRGIVLKNADNVEITSGKLSLSHITIYEITNPREGTWSLTVPGSNGDHEYSVKSSSDTNVDFDHYFLIKLSWHRQPTEVPISNPVVGKPVSFLAE